MATTTNVYIDKLKGASQNGNLSVYRVTANVTGTYATASKPSYNFMDLLTTQHENTANVTVISTQLLQDYNDGAGNVYTAPNANIVLSNVRSGCTKDSCVFRVDSGATNGTAGSEISDGTALAGSFQFLVLCSVSKS